MGVQLKSELQHTTTQSAGTIPPLCLCYCPTVYFLHFYLIAHFLPHGKLRLDFPKMLLFNF